MAYSKSTILMRYLSTAALITMLLGIGAGVIAAPPDRGGGLFADAAVESSSDPADDPTIVRTRFVEPDFDLLGGADGSPVADVLELNLFDDAAFTAVLDRTESNPSGSLSWMGHLEGVAYGSVILVVRDGVMVGSVTMPRAFYQIRYAGHGVHVIHEMDPAAFPPELEPIPVDTLDGVPVEAFIAPTADDGSTIDVLVVYTDDARATVGSTTAMENLIDQAILETNQSYLNSGISQRVNLVHTAEVSYDETDFDWSTTLSRLKDTSDGYMDNVHTLRDNYCADEVVLIVEDTASCGLAYLMWSVSPFFASSAFAVVSRTCATGYYSLGHEMGHNMGARHDWYVDDSITPYSYSHAYVNVTDRWRTVMAYNTECDCSDEISPCPLTDSRSTPGSPYCPRLQYWSNPSVTYGGDPMGVPLGTSTDCVAGDLNHPDCDADNRLTLNNTAYTVANFRDSSICSPPSYTISGDVRDSSGTGIGGVTVDFGGARPAVTTNGIGNYTQTGFDNGTYTVTLNLNGYVFSPVVDQVTVSSADVTHDVTGYPFNPASLPFTDGFESGVLGSSWAVETDYQGRVRVDSTYPYTGRYSLLLDNDTNDGLFSHASAILALDLSGLSQATLTFWWREFDDEDHPDDGVFISDNYGATWYQAFSFAGATDTYTQTIVDLDDAVSTAGMSLNDHFLVKFQFYDNWPVASDGYAIDDVVVASEGLVYHGHTVDDDTADQSAGDGNGRIDCGETIELSVDLYNQGLETVTGTVATITTSDTNITWTHNFTSTYPDIPSWGMGTNNNDFEFEVDPNAPHGHVIHFDLTVDAASGGPWSSAFDIRMYCASAYAYMPVVLKQY